MTDIEKALEKAAEAAFKSLKGEFNPWLNAAQREKAVEVAARAAVLAFLKAMPDWDGVTGRYLFPSALAAAIEKETAP